MNPAFDRTLSLLVEIKSNIPTPGKDSSGKPSGFQSKVFFDVTNDKTLNPLANATPSRSMSTRPKSKPERTKSKPRTFYDKLVSLLKFTRRKNK